MTTIDMTESIGSAFRSETRLEPCPFCGRMLERECFIFFGKLFRGPLERCGCTGSRAEEDRAAAEEESRRREAAREEFILRRKASGLGAHQFTQTLESFRTDRGNRAAYDAAQDFALNFCSRKPEEPVCKGASRGLMIIGGAGVGKSHLAAGIANYVLSGGGYVTFRSTPELLGELKRSYNDGDDDEYSLLLRFKRTALLILDDLGKEQQTEWSLARMYEIVNSRYEHCMPVVVTANYSLPALEERMAAGGDRTTAKAIVSRLAEMCRRVGITGSDWRTRRER